MSGIALGMVAAVSPLIWLLLAAATWLASVAATRHAAITSVLIALTAIFAGALAGRVDYTGFSPDHVAHLTGDQPRLARLQLRIADPPRQLPGNWGQSKQIARAEVLAVAVDGDWRRCDGQVALSLNNADGTLRLGQRIEALGWLARPAAADNPGEFDWNHYYRADRILARFQITDRACLRDLSSDAWQPLWRIRRWTSALLDRGFSPSQNIQRGLLQAIVLGRRDPVIRPIQDQFIATGTAYLIVISGLHVLVVAGALELVCRLLRLRPRRSALIVVVGVTIYGLLVLPSVPPARAVLFCALALLGAINRRSIDLLQLLGLCAILILVIHPMDLATVSFQLSFAAVFVLIIYGPRASRWIYGLRAEAIDLIAAPTPRRRRSAFIRWTTNALLSTCIAWLGILPLILYYFYQFNPWAIVCGATLAPVVLAIVLLGLGKILITLIIPPLAPSYAALAAGAILVMQHLLTWMANLPGGSQLLAPPPVWLIGLYYLLLLLPLIRWPIGRRAMRLAPILGVGLIFMPTFAAMHHDAQPSLRCTILSVGAGSCCVIESPDGHVAIIDAGSSTITDLARIVVNPFLRQRRIAAIDDLFLSHPDSDHYNATSRIISDFPTHQVLLNDAFVEHANRSHEARQLLNWFERTHRWPEILSAGEQIALGRQVMVSDLWPGPKSNWGGNDDSMVLRIRYAGRTILIPGDIESVAERQLINGGINLASDVLIAPHHGSSVDMTRFFVDQVNPQWIISSNDRTLSSKQLRFDRIVRGRTLYRTSHCGAVTITISQNGKIKVQPYLPH